jgi:DNA-binding response OmpR family regulator
MAFAMGVDDYIIKPFHQAELRARVDAKLRKHGEQEKEQEIVQMGDIKLDLGRQRVSILAAFYEEELQLTRLEFKLLTKFMKSPERVFARDYLIENIWGDSTNISDRTVDTHIANLRKKILRSNVKIETVSGEGYRLKIPSISQSKPNEFPR